MRYENQTKKQCDIIIIKFKSYFLPMKTYKETLNDIRIIFTKKEKKRRIKLNEEIAENHNISSYI